ncbi:MAG: sensor histidine kinase [Candidatus Kariarchaeaceae archaeon]
MIEGQELHIAFALITINMIVSANFIVKLTATKRKSIIEGGMFGLFVALVIVSGSNFIMLITTNRFVSECSYYISLLFLPFISGFLAYIAIVKINKFKTYKQRFKFVPLILACLTAIVHISIASVDDLSFEEGYTEITTGITSVVLITYYSIMGILIVILFFYLFKKTQGADRIQNNWLFLAILISSFLEIVKFFIFDESNYGESLTARFIGMTTMSSLIVFSDYLYNTSDVSKLRLASFYRSDIIPIFYYDNDNKMISSNTGLRNLLHAWPGAPLPMSDFEEALLIEFPDREFPQEPAIINLRVKPYFPSRPKRIQATFTPLPNINEYACLIIDLSTEDEKWEKHKEVINQLTHDIRNPMTIISGALDILEIDSDDEAVNSLMDMIKSANEKIHVLINEFFIVENDGETTFEPEEFEPIKEAIRISEAFVSIFNSKKQVFSITLKETSNKIIASKMDFYRILTNILSNAHYHTKNKTKIKITSLIKDNTIKLIIKDWGQGIDPEKVKTLFIRKTISYKDALAESGRLGIGLYSVYLLIERNGGIITYNDNKKGGAIFTLSFPISSN